MHRLRLKCSIHRCWLRIAKLHRAVLIMCWVNRGQVYDRHRRRLHLFYSFLAWFAVRGEWFDHGRQLKLRSILNSHELLLVQSEKDGGVWRWDDHFSLLLGWVLQARSLILRESRTDRIELHWVLLIVVVEGVFVVGLHGYAFFVSPKWTTSHSDLIEQGCVLDAIH